MAAIGPQELISRKIIPISHNFSLAQLNNILILAGHYMKPEQPMLFKFSHDEVIADFFKISIIPQLRSPLNLTDLKKLLEGKLSASPIKYDPTQMNHVWAYLIKTTFKNCQLISCELNEMLIWRLFIDDLKKMYIDYIPTLLAKNQQGLRYDFSGIDKDRIQNVFLHFMMRLYQIGNFETIRALHQLLHLARRVGQTPESTMGLLELGTYIGPCLHFALFRNLFPAEDVNNVVHSECSYFAKITGSLLEHPFFNQSFEIADYAAMNASLSKMQITPEQQNERVRAIFCPVETLTFEDPIKKLENEMRQLSLSQQHEEKKIKASKKEKSPKKDKAVREVKAKRLSIPAPLPAPLLHSFENERRGGRLTPRASVDTCTDTIVQSAQNDVSRPTK